MKKDENDPKDGRRLRLLLRRSLPTLKLDAFMHWVKSRLTGGRWRSSPKRSERFVCIALYSYPLSCFRGFASLTRWVFKMELTKAHTNDQWLFFQAVRCRFCQMTKLKSWDSSFASYRRVMKVQKKKTRSLTKTVIGWLEWPPLSTFTLDLDSQGESHGENKPSFAVCRDCNLENYLLEPKKWRFGRWFSGSSRYTE